MNIETEKQVDNELLVGRFPERKEHLYDLSNHDSKWVSLILEQLESEVPDSRGELHVSLNIMKKHTKELKYYVLINGEISGSYTTQCVKCLEPTVKEFSHDFKTCFLHHALEGTPEFQELTTIFTDGDERELYFYHKGTIHLDELLHEQVHLTIDPFPVHDENCKGLCSICGTNLNTSLCEHVKTQ